MISLENITVFVRAAELGSFSAAGRVLRMSAAVVSYRVHVLEKDLGCRLLNRTTRRMSLTEPGRIFFERCIEVVEAVNRAEASVTGAGAAPRGVLKVTAPLGLGRRVIAPFVSEFQQIHPETDVRLRLSDHLLDLTHEGMDIAIRMAQLWDSSFTQRKIADVERVLVAAPSYLSAYGEPSRPQDLLKHRCLLLRFPGSRQFRWTLLRGGETLTLPVSGPMDADDGDVLTGWALAGGGIALKPLFEIAEHLGSGALVPVLPDFPPQSVTLAVLYPTRRLMASRLKCFVDLAVAKVRRHIDDTMALLPPAARGGTLLRPRGATSIGEQS